MTPLTVELLVKGMNTTPLIAAAWLNPLMDAANEFEINTRQRMIKWLSNIALESLGLQLTHELWGPTVSQVRYERDIHSPWPKTDAEARMPAFAANRLAYTLGNSEPGDGRKYAGQGPLQITGRGNMKRCGDALGYDLLQFPASLAVPLAGARSAGWFFKTHGCNQLADTGDIVVVRKRINGGINGLPEVTKFDANLARLIP